MVRRVVEEDVYEPTVVERDGSWVGRTIVTLVLIALVVIGAIWLVNNVVDSGGGNGTNVEINDNDSNPGGDTGGDTGDSGETNENPLPSPS